MRNRGERGKEKKERGEGGVDDGEAPSTTP